MRTEATDRVRVIFSLLDANGNGVLDPDDFELMGQRVVAAVPDADSAAKDAMVSAFRRYWTTLSDELDADGDGTISWDEFTACVLSPERFDRTVADFAEALARLGDPRGDGMVPRPAFVALMTAIGFGQANIETLFDAFGPTADDRIPVATWVAGIKDYYSPEKAGIPGDLLVGSADA
ncbi:EF-hand domain-containing protein [Actinacidiphila alni]|uniref:EF-hand domain-containing protein n=1 Tax=Actinacidiphila alni TaxID=380248 RepID=UPI003456FC77